MTKRTEKAISQVLVGLRDSEAPAGMERRILEAVQDRASVKSASRWSRLTPMWLAGRPTSWNMASRTWSVALASTVVICFAVSIIRRIEHTSIQSNRHSIQVVVRPSIAAGVIAKSAKLPQPEPDTRTRGKTNARRTQPTSNSDSVALYETRTASFPAPPMPLTEQEKLLLRIAHKQDPVQLASLDPALRAARNSEEKAEVQRFFEPSKTGDNE